MYRKHHQKVKDFKFMAGGPYTMRGANLKLLGTGYLSKRPWVLPAAPVATKPGVYVDDCPAKDKLVSSYCATPPASSKLSTTCAGDPGSPLTEMDPDLIIVGILSRAEPPHASCSDPGRVNVWNALSDDATKKWLEPFVPNDIWWGCAPSPRVCNRIIRSCSELHVLTPGGLGI